MDSKVNRGRKRSKKQRFQELAMRRWSKMESSDNDVSNYEENRGSHEGNRGSGIVTEEDSEDTRASLSGDHSTIHNTTDTASEAESSEYFPTPIKKLHTSQDVSYTEGIELGNRIFLCQTTQLQAFIDIINTTALCHTSQCTGKLMPIDVKHVGLGGSILVKFTCSGCANRMLSFPSSAEIDFSRRTICSLALQVAFIAGGCMHSQNIETTFRNVSNQC